MSAVGERIRPGVLSHPQQPSVMVHHRAVLPCGCAVYVGSRLDNREAATVSVACDGAHTRLMTHFSLLLRESLVAPLARPLVDVVVELLDEACRHAHPTGR